MPVGVHANTGVVVLAPESGGVHGELLAAVRQAAQSAGVSLQVVASAAAVPSAARLVLTLGSRALRDAAERSQAPVLAAFIPHAVWQASATGVPSGSSAIWLDQPVRRMVELAAQSMPQRRRLGVLLGPTSSTLEGALDRAVAARGLIAVKARVDNAPAEELFPALQGVLQNADLLLALPDPALYNAESLQNVLIATYRQRVPMLSYTAAHARAGATLALHTPLEDVAAQLARALRQFAIQGVLPAPEGPQGFSVVVNEQVARSLSLDLRSPAELQVAIRRAEGRSP